MCSTTTEQNINIFGVHSQFYALFSDEIYRFSRWKGKKKAINQMPGGDIARGYCILWKRTTTEQNKGNTIFTLGTQSMSARQCTLIERQFVHLLFRLHSFLLVAAVIFKTSNGKCTHTHTELIQLHHIKIKCSGGSYSRLWIASICICLMEKWTHFPPFCHCDFDHDVFFISNVNFDWNRYSSNHLKHRVSIAHFAHHLDSTWMFGTAYILHCLFVE